MLWQWRRQRIVFKNNVRIRVNITGFGSVFDFI